MLNNAEIPVVILAGGRGARFDHESQVTPKPMIRVGDRPMLEHIIESFAAQGFREFIVAAGYLGDVIIDYYDRTWEKHHLGPFYFCGPSKLIVIDTGENANTGERLWKLRNHIGNRRFILTYGDGLSDVNMHAVLAQHDYHVTWADNRGDHPPIVTLTAVHPPGRFGVLRMRTEAWHPEEQQLVNEFQEKPLGERINGGFMVIDPKIFGWLREPCDCCMFELEREVLPDLAAAGRLAAFQHDGYWRCMDTRRDLEQIEADMISATDKGLPFPWLRRA